MGVHRLDLVPLRRHDVLEMRIVCKDRLAGFGVLTRDRPLITAFYSLIEFE
jgi:hypothetical protein